MSTVAHDLDLCQRMLRDSGRLWPRTELLRWYVDAYRRLLALSHGTRQLRVLDVPPRHTLSCTYPWETRYSMGGTVRQWTHNGVTGSKTYSYAWEASQAEDYLPAGRHSAVTQLWELGYVHESIDTPFRFAFPKSHERIAGVWWDNKHLEPVTVRELDGLETAWYRQQGEPWHITSGHGGTQTFEMYEIQTAYATVYSIYGDGLGMPRSLEPGDRTYETVGEGASHTFAYTTQADALHWERQTPPDIFGGSGYRMTGDGPYHSTNAWFYELRAGETTFTDGITVGTAAWEQDYGAENMANMGLGCIRTILSPERQYVPQGWWEPPLGTIREWQSSDDALLIWEVIIPDVPDLTEADQPVLIPPPLQKYLRYYVLAMAFHRQGEGTRPDLAAHWGERWARGAKLLRKFSDCTWADVQYARSPVARGTHSMPPLPQLPSNYPAWRD